ERAHQKQSAGREQEKRERDLANDQRISDPAASGLPAFVLASAPCEVGRGRVPRQCPGGPRAEQQRGRQTEPYGSGEHAPVGVEFGKAQGDGEHGTEASEQRVGCPDRQEQSDRASRQREEQPFGDQLTSEASSAAPK